MSDNVTLPVNLADTGPILMATPTLYTLASVSSNLSQPGMQTLSTSGSLSASQACCCVTASCRLACISMMDSFYLDLIMPAQ